MEEFSVLSGGKAGFGIDKAALILGHLLNQCGYRIYIYHDYPSLIRGGHTFSIIRAARARIGAHRERIDLLLALNRETFDLHQTRLSDGAWVLYDADAVKGLAPADRFHTLGLPIGTIIKEEKAPEVMRNTCMIGALAKTVGIPLETLARVIAEGFPKEAELNVKIAGRGFAAAETVRSIAPPAVEPLPLISGSQAIGLGLIKGGLQDYVAYPMTPTTPLLHFLAEQADDFSLKVIHPESEIGVMLMALGFAYAGERAAVGTSGGGFCLMTEGLSLSAMSETPVVVVLGQRPGPSTGLPTYSGQTDLHFALHAGQGEFVRFLAAPGDLEEAYYWSALALHLAWKYQIPAIVLTDKNLGEGIANFDIGSVEALPEVSPSLWAGKAPYRRYEDGEGGISPLAFPPLKDAVIKVNSYEHDASGITTEEGDVTKKMQDKRLRKESSLREELKGFRQVKTYGSNDRSTALLCWGSTTGACREVAEKLGLAVVQPVVLSPFPEDAFRAAVSGVKKLIAVENSATGQLARLIRNHGFCTDAMILKYDGRPFSLDELEASVEEAIR
ncbi:MAG: 2-oxoacid:acceptor oxidoreductase subunit alpha [Syntrophales bacterium]